MIWAYFKHELLLLTRKRISLVLSILLPIIFYIIFTTIIQLPEFYEAKFYKEYMFSMAVFSLSSFCLLTFPIDLIKDKQTGWQKNLFKTPLSPSSYYLGKTMKIMLLFCVAIILLFVTGHVYKGVSLSFDKWIVSGIFLWLGASTLLSLGILIAQIRDIENASHIANLVYLVLAMVSGLWFPVDQFPQWLQKIAYVMPTYHIKELAQVYVEESKVHVVSCCVLIAYVILFLMITYAIRKKRK